MKDIFGYMDGGTKVVSYNKKYKSAKMLLLASLLLLAFTSSAFAQGSIFGIVANSDLSTPVNGEITFVGYLDNTDEEIRIETADGAGYDAGNWFDDFQNYLTEAPGNPYDYVFYNTTNGQGFQLSNVIPNNSFQQENVLLAPVTWPSAPLGFVGQSVSSTTVILSWNATAGNTYHVYRRSGISNGSFFRLDDPTGALTNPGVADSFYVDATVDGVSAYDYLIIAEDASGNLSPHSPVITVSPVIVAPVLTSLNPISGITLGGTTVDIYGSGFDPAGVNVLIGTQTVVATVVSPVHLTIIAPAAPAGVVDVSAANVSSALSSNVLLGAYTYTANALPVLAPIGPQTVVEGVPLAVNVSATDPDLDIPALSTSLLPGTATFTDNLDGTGLLGWTPSFTEAGIYNVTFYATDAVTPSLVDSEIVQITVTEAGNQLPLLAPISDTAIAEGGSLVIAVSASDPDAEIPTLSALNIPVNSTFLDNGDGTGSLTFNPDFVQAGIYNVTFFATDLVGSDSAIVAITVTEAGNQLPVLAPIGPQAGTEGAPLAVAITATDAESIPILTTTVLPTGATFVDNADGTGQLNWVPDFIQSGVYNVTFYASDGVATDSEIVTITIAEAGNQLPVLAAIGPQVATENVLLTVAISSSDPEGVPPTLTTSALPTGALFTDNGNGTGSFDWTPDFLQAGIYNISFYATDDSLAVDSELVTITVNDAGNQSPVLAAIGAQTVAENVLLTFGVSATDPESIPTLTTSLLPSTATFIDNADGTGTFNWTPSFTDAGTYPITFYASDGVLVDSEIVTITVTESGNQNPVLAAIGAQAIVEGALLNIAVSATDAESIPTLTTSLLPGTATFIDNADGTGSFAWTPAFADAGVYSVTFYATDAALAVDSEIVSITVTDAGNQAPLLTAIGAQSVTETIQLTFGVTAVDPDGGIPTMTTSLLPGTATFLDNGDGSGTFDWTPGFTDAGVYAVTFYATDAALAVDSEIVTITVLDIGNQNPVLAIIGTQTVAEGATLSTIITATDPDGDIPILTTSLLPGTATFGDSLNGTGELTWATTFLDAGSYVVTFYATDAAVPTAVDSEVVTIIVGESGNQPPTFVLQADTAINEGQILALTVSATDPEGSAVSFSLNTTTVGHTFVDNANGTATFTYQPGYLDAGIDTVRFIAFDQSLPPLSSIMTVIVTTIDFNQPPIIDSTGPFTVDALDTLIFDIVATDTTDDINARIFLSTLTLPANASFTDNGDNTGTFTFAPTIGQVGLDSVTFLATDTGTPSLTGMRVVNFEVLMINFPPQIDSIGPQVVQEGATLTINMTGSDPEGVIPTFEAVNAPLNSTMTDNGNGTATFVFTPSFIQSGLYYVTFKVSDGIDTDKEIVVIQVLEAGDQAPIFTYVPISVVTEANTLGDSIVAIDPDLDVVVLTIDSTTIPANFTFTDQGGGFGIFGFLPDYTQQGTYNITLFATAGSLVDTAVLIIDVIDAGNQLPVLAPIPDYTVGELNNLLFTVTASDVDGTIPTFSSSVLPGAATFTDAGNGSAVFNWTPTALDSGVYNLMIYAEDGAFPGVFDSQAVIVTVVDTNRAPWIFIPPLQPDTVSEGASLVWGIVSWDDDGPIPVLSAHLSGADTLATNMVFFDSGNGGGTLTFNPDFSQGDDRPSFYNIVFRAVDSVDALILTESSTQTIRVFDVPLPPQMNFSAGIGPFTINEGQNINFTIVAYDPDNSGIPTIQALNLPAGAVANVAMNNLAFNFTPGFTQAGVYNITFIAQETWIPLMADTQIVQITVLEAGNQAPFFVTTLPTQTVVFAGIQYTEVIDATDLDGDVMTLTVLNAPLLGTNLINNGNGSWDWVWMPDAADLGTIFPIQFIVTDPFGAADTITSDYGVANFMRGDADTNGKYTINDIVYLTGYLFRGGSSPSPIESGDVDLSGDVNVSDIAYMVNFLYKSGPRPPQ